MNKHFSLIRYIITVLIAVFIFSVSIPAQQSDAERWTKAQQEMKSMLGAVPVMFEKLPARVRADAWEWFKSLNNPKSSIPAKYADLISLGVAAQIPCQYCVYAHIQMAKANGATDEEIYEAVERAAEVRHWSTVLNGNDVDLQEFKTQWDEIMAYMKAHAQGK